MMRVILWAVALCLLWTSPAYAALFGLFGDSVRNVRAEDGLVVLDVSDLPPGESRHYRYREGKTAVRFFLARDAGGTVRAALDACEVCWREGKGYTLKDGAMLCRNCGRFFPLSRIGMVRGGCNPHPLPFNLEGARVSVSAGELLSGARYFPENL